MLTLYEQRSNSSVPFKIPFDPLHFGCESFIEEETMSLAFEHFVAHHNWVFFKLSETDSAIGPQPNEDDQQRHIKFESFDLLSCIDVGNAEFI